MMSLPDWWRAHEPPVVSQSAYEAFMRDIEDEIADHGGTDADGIAFLRGRLAADYRPALAAAFALALLAGDGDARARAILVEHRDHHDPDLRAAIGRWAA